ncbi:MAG: hypothetical protein NVS3B5_21110 [Sphingomicrobium sp.]
MTKTKKATDQLNVALAGISSALTVAKTFLGPDHPALDVLNKGAEYCEEARDALLTIQFHAAQL